MRSDGGCEDEFEMISTCKLAGNGMRIRGGSNSSISRRIYVVWIEFAQVMMINPERGDGSKSEDNSHRERVPAAGVAMPDSR